MKKIIGLWLMMKKIDDGSVWGSEKVYKTLWAAVP